jgi:hypothetical protein
MKTKIILFIIGLFYCIGAVANDIDLEKIFSKSKNKVNPLHANGFNYVSLGLEAGPTLNNYSSSSPIHYGLPVKVYLGRQKKGRFILRTGVHYFPVPSSNLFAGTRSIHSTIVPLAIGYRRNINDWYIEGSIGAAANMFTRKYNDPTISTTKITYREINYGFEIGRQLGDFDIGLAVYNTGPIPFNMLYAGFKGSYRLKW